jgi:hypothetical protein
MTVVSTLRNDWPLAVMVAGTLATIAVVVACIIAVTEFGRDSLTFLAAVFACFALIKMGVAIKAIRELRRFNHAVATGAPGAGAPASGDVPEDPRIDFGGPARYRTYIAFKFVTAALAMVAALVILVHGPAQAWTNASTPPPATAAPVH